MGIEPPKYYRRCVEDCCRKAVIAEDVDQRSHWLEAAARWFSLAREEGILPPARTSKDAAPSKDSRTRRS
jgi:hypothetical protein